MNGWRLTKEVSIADLLAVLGAATAIFVAWNALSERMVIQEAAGKEMILRDAKRDTDIRELKIEFKDALNRIEDKLDRVIERR